MISLVAIVDSWYVSAMFLLKNWIQMQNLCQNNDWCNYIQAFAITFSFGMGAIPWLMMSEVHYLVAYIYLI
jgi:hypothetical protein